MIWLKTLWDGIARYGWLILAAVAAVFTYHLLRRGAAPAEVIRGELDVIAASAEARTLEVDTSTELAVEAIEGRYREEIAQMDETRKAKLQKLRKDPAALSRFLVRAARRSAPLAVLLAAAATLAPVTARADCLATVADPGEAGLVCGAVCAPDRPGLCALELKVGEPSPFTGQLLTVDLALELGDKADSCDSVVRREVRRVTEVGKVRVDAADAKAQIQAQAAERLAGLLRVTSGAAPPERPFYEHPAILVGAGVVVGAAVTTLTYKITRTP